MKNEKTSELGKILNHSIFCTGSTKGGVGKSTISSQVLPLLAELCKKKVSLYELDNNNFKNEKTDADAKIKYQNFDINDSNRLISSTILYKHIHHEISDELIIIDAGGGDDTNAVIDYLADNEITNIVYFIPVNRSAKQFSNTLKTVEKIRKFDKESLIYIVFNGYEAKNERGGNKTIDEIKSEFVGFFGTKEFGIKGRVSELKNLINGFFFTPYRKEYDILESYLDTTLFEFYDIAKSVVENISEDRKTWSEEDFLEKNNRFKIARSVCNIFDETLESFRNIESF